MRATPALYFKGNCENALLFYQTCGLGKIEELRRYEGTPLAERHGGAWRDKVLHAVFTSDDPNGLKLFGSDGPDSEPMKGCALLLEEHDLDAARALFTALSANGRVTVPFAKQFWGEYYGNFTDQFGVQWAMSCRATTGA
jgi:PhnB protein